MSPGRVLRVPRSDRRATSRLASLLGALLFSIQCGGGGGGSGTTSAPHFTCTGSVAPAADHVALSCSATSGSPILIAVKIGGPSVATDIYGFKFDLVTNPAFATFLGPAMQGTFLDRDSNPVAVQADIPPSDPGRVVVSITRLGSVSGLQVLASQELVMTLGFVSTGMNGMTNLTFENMEAIDSTLAPIAGIQFDGPLSLTYQ
jgi:hypothetical protein